MNRKILPFLLISVYPVFLFTEYIHQRLIIFFNVDNQQFVNGFFDFITLTTALMLTNIILVSLLKPKITGYVFLAWSMLKIMLVMAYFIFFVYGKDLQPDNNEILEIVSIYMIYLFYEVVFTYFSISRDGNIKIYES